MRTKKLVPYLLFILFIPGIISCNENDISTAPAPNATTPYQEVKMTLEEKEKSSPLDFLKLFNVVYRKNFIGQWVIEGTVENHASVASYKDVVLDIIFYSKTETEIGRIQKTLYEFVQPNNYQTFKYKTPGYEGSDLIGVEIKSAIAAK